MMTNDVYDDDKGANVKDIKYSWQKNFQFTDTRAQSSPTQTEGKHEPQVVLLQPPSSELVERPTRWCRHSTKRGHFQGQIGSTLHGPPSGIQLQGPGPSPATRNDSELNQRRINAEAAQQGIAHNSYRAETIYSTLLYSDSGCLEQMVIESDLTVFNVYAIVKNIP